MFDTSNLAEGVVFQSRSRASCNETAIVLDALDIPCEVLKFEGTYLLIVQSIDVEEATQQINLYLKEDQKKPLPQIDFPSFSKGVPGIIIYVILLLIVDTILHNKSLNINLIDAGSANAGLIRQGELWRTVTALTLHSGFVHLLGNLVFGALFALFASQLLGSGLAWFCILMAGAMGNLTSALMQSDTHIAIGASTAVFAALGIQSAYTWRMRHLNAHRGIRRWLPIIGGVILLALLGGPGERIDVVSHVTGFVCGLFTGAFFGGLGRQPFVGRGLQVILGGVTLFIVGLAWFVAIGW